MQGHPRDLDRIALWVRSYSPPATAPRLERALDRARSLERREVVSVDVGVWGKTVERSSDREVPGDLDRVTEALDAFADWAERAGRSLDPFFRTRRLEPTVLVDSSVVQRLPTVALAEYRDDELVHVAPSREGDRVVDVHDRLARLETLADERDDRSLSYSAGIDREGRDDVEDVTFADRLPGDGERGGSTVTSPMNPGSPAGSNR